jgi:hypothetical protein
MTARDAEGAEVVQSGNKHSLFHLSLESCNSEILSKEQFDLAARFSLKAFCSS